MRILFLTKRFYTNKDLISDRFGRLFHVPVELSKSGHDVAVLALDYRGNSPATLEAEGVSFASVPSRGIHGLTVWRQLKGAATEFDPDVVIGSTDTPLGWLAQRLARKTGSRFVFDVYDNYRSFASARIPGMSHLFNRLLRSADLVTAVSDPLVELARQHSSNVARIVNGVDREAFKPMDRREARSELGLDPDCTLVGYIGALEPERGIETLVAAVEGLRVEGVPAELLFAGVDKLHLAWHTDWVTYRGVVPHHEVPRLINACDVVVLPYLPNEWGGYTFPFKLAEYIACGVPVVATKTSGFASVMADASQGLCEPADPGSMTRAIRAQLDDPVRLPTDTVVTWAELAEELVAAMVALPKTRPAVD